MAPIGLNLCRKDGLGRKTNDFGVGHCGKVLEPPNAVAAEQFCQHQCETILATRDASPDRKSVLHCAKIHRR
jgi:hypothetical protein